MSKTLTHKGFTGSVEPQEDGTFGGKLQGVDSLVLYDGDDMAELEKNFRNIVDFHIECEMAEAREAYDASPDAKPLKRARA